MNWFGRTLVRAGIWQGMSEMRYQAHQQQRRTSQGRYHAPVPHQQASNREVKVTFGCPQGHRWVQSFWHENSPTEKELASGRCPECGDHGKWLALDYHRENDAL